MARYQLTFKSGAQVVIEGDGQIEGKPLIEHLAALKSNGATDMVWHDLWIHLPDIVCMKKIDSVGE